MSGANILAMCLTQKSTIPKCAYKTENKIFLPPNISRPLIYCEFSLIFQPFSLQMATSVAAAMELYNTSTTHKVNCQSNQIQTLTWWWWFVFYLPDCLKGLSDKKKKSILIHLNTFTLFWNVKFFFPLWLSHWWTIRQHLNVLKIQGPKKNKNKK